MLDLVPIHPEARYTLLVMLALAAMAAVEIAYYKVHRRNFDFTMRRDITPASRAVIRKKFVALAVTLGAATALYALLFEYRMPIGAILDSLWRADVKGLLALRKDHWYLPFFVMYVFLVPLALACAVPYFRMAARSGRWADEDDDLVIAYEGYASLARGRRPGPRFWNVMKGFAVKFFFVPLMVCAFTISAFNLERVMVMLMKFSPEGKSATALYEQVYRCLYEGIFFVDLSFAVIGYLFTARLFDTHIRSAEPTAIGWLVTLACYRPFLDVSDRFLAYNPGGRTWIDHCGGHPALFMAVGAVVVALIFVFVWSTVTFGLRFSNLTNRGVISRGPYAIVRHPAYAAKCLSYWLIAMPFLDSFGSVVRLLGWNAIYFARAITEERHLAADPHYAEYRAKVRHRFIPGMF